MGETWGDHLHSQFSLEFPNLPPAFPSVLAGESFPLMDDVTDFRADAGLLQSKPPQRSRLVSISY